MLADNSGECDAAFRTDLEHEREQARKLLFAQPADVVPSVSQSWCCDNREHVIAGHKPAVLILVDRFVKIHQHFMPIGTIHQFRHSCTESVRQLSKGDVRVRSRDRVAAEAHECPQPGPLGLLGTLHVPEKVRETEAAGVAAVRVGKATKRVCVRQKDRNLSLNE